MTPTAPLSFETHAAEQLLRQRDELTRAWVTRIATAPQRRCRAVRASEPLLDVFPEVLQYVAGFLRADEEAVLTDEPAVIEPLRTLARLRHRQGCGPQELIHEFELLAQILDGACLAWLRSFPAAPAPDAVVRVAGRLNRAPILMGEISIGAYFEEERAARVRAKQEMQEFADVLIHELKTPLSAAESAALLLENDEVVSSSQVRRRFAGLIQRNLRRARTVIGNVRELTIARASQADCGRWLPIGVVLGEVLAEARETVEQAGTMVEVAEPIPDLVVDACRVEIILLNLISNAAKYADPAQPRRWVRIGFTCRPEQGLWWLYVSDNGLGIPPEHQERLFQRSFRAHPECAEGSGLGLAIVAQAVSQLGGRIEFESQPGAGSTFRVLLPPAAGAGGRGVNGAMSARGSALFAAPLPRAAEPMQASLGAHCRCPLPGHARGRRPSARHPRAGPPERAEPQGGAPRLRRARAERPGRGAGSLGDLRIRDAAALGSSGGGDGGWVARVLAEAGDHGVRLADLPGLFE
jgi:signal transduction histidine kinase